MDLEQIDGFNNRTIVPASDTARSAQAAAAAIADLSCPPKLSEVGSTLVAVREAFSDAAEVCAERTESFSGQLTSVVTIFREAESDNASQIRALEV